MKKLHLNVYVNETRIALGKYYIFFGRDGGRRYFSSKKLVDKFIVEYKKYITVNSRLVVELAEKSTSIYSRNFQVLNAYDTRKISDLISDFWKQSQMIFQDHGEGYDSIALDKIQVCYNLIFDMMIIYKNFAQKNNLHYLSNDAKSLNHLYLLCVNDFESNRYDFIPESDTKVIPLIPVYKKVSER